MVFTEWGLFTGATPKLERLHWAVEQAGLGVKVQQIFPGVIDEKNHYKASALLFADKAHQVWEKFGQQLKPTMLYLVMDVHPKAKEAHAHQYLKPLLKHPDIDEIPVNSDARLSVLANYICSQFSYYGDNPVDIRQSAGVVPMTNTGMKGVVIERAYIHYPDNPIPSEKAAIEMLSYAQMTCDVVGAADSAPNKNWDINVGAAGAILQVPMIEWYLQTNPKKTVQVDVASEDKFEPLDIITQLSTGFTIGLVRQIEDLAKCNRPAAITVLQTVERKVRRMPDSSATLVWSMGEQRAVVV